MVDDPAAIDSVSLQKQAIQAALSCEWEKALKLNEQLLDLDGNNPDCLNRLAKAYTELGKYSQAKKIYDQVLEIDPYNTIAQKNLKKVTAFKKGDGVIPGNHIPNIISASCFLEEPGLTKIVNLIKVAEPQRLLTLSAGQLVDLVVKSRGITVIDAYNQYLGVLPDDIAFHMQKLIKGGNKYQCFIKSIKANALSILIREIFRSKKFKNQASFLDEGKILAYSSDNIALFNDDNEDDTQENASDDSVV